MTKRVLFLGFGDIAGRAARLFLAAGWQVTGLRRTPSRVDGVTMVAGDCRDRALLASLFANQDLVVASLTPDSYSEDGYRRGYLEPAQAIRDALIQASARPALVLWVSSTSVYGQGNGDWVDEDSPAAPGGFSGRTLLESEEMVASTTVPATAIRFSGIYGPGRDRLIRQVREGRCAAAEPVQWSNRIHVDDCARIIHHLASRHFAGSSLDPVYIGTDCEPVPLHEVHRWLAARLGVAPATAESAGSRGNRRCSNRRLLATGFRFLYPTFREGYGALVAEGAQS